MLAIGFLSLPNFYRSVRILQLAIQDNYAVMIGVVHGLSKHRSRGFIV